ncbi:hypothetical protein [Methylobacterium flocculans]|nr:hypothetical protein [Methylobacterium sp. FF17]
MASFTQADTDERTGSPMPQMFDWIFFAIVLPVPAFLVWDWYRDR